MFHSPLDQLDVCAVRASFIFGIVEEISFIQISMPCSGFSVCYSIFRDDPLCSGLFGSLVVD